MENDTIILMGLLLGVLSWFLVLHIKEGRQYIKQSEKDALEQLERRERIRQLTNKL